MGKIYNSFRAWWNDLGDRFTDQSKLAQLNIADMEKALIKARDAAATFVGRPVRLKNEISELEQKDYSLVSKIRLLKESNEDDSAKRLIDYLLDVRKELESKRTDYQESKEVAEAWKLRIKSIEKELERRRRDATDLKERDAAAAAMIKLGIAIEAVDRHAKADAITKYESVVKAKEEKSAGYMALAGLDESAAIEQKIRDAEIDALFASM